MQEHRISPSEGRLSERIGSMTVEHWMTPASHHARPADLASVMRLLRHGGFDHLPVVGALQLERLERQALIAPTLKARLHSLSHTPLLLAARLLVTLEVGGLGVARGGPAASHEAKGWTPQRVHDPSPRTMSERKKHELATCP